MFRGTAQKLILWALPSLLLAGCLQSGVVSNQIVKLPNPTLSFSQMPSSILGDVVFTLQFDAHAAPALYLTSVQLQLSIDANGYQTLANLPGGASSYSWHTPALDIQGAKLRLIVVDNRDNQTITDSSAFDIRYKAPNFTQTVQPALLLTQTRVVDYYGGACEINLPVQIDFTRNPPGQTGSDTATCVGGVWAYKATVASDSKTDFVFSQTKGALSTRVLASWTSDQNPPVITSVVLNNGKPSASNNVLPVVITANDPAPDSGIAGYRLSIRSDFANAPWRPTAPTNFTFPHTTGNYTLYVQVKDGAGNLSNVVSVPIYITIGSPPMLDVVQPSGLLGFTTAGQAIHVSWKIALVSPVALVANSLNVYYTTDSGLTQTAWPGGSALSVGMNGGCTLDPLATGCVDLTVPAAVAAKPFKMILTVADQAGNVSIILSAPLNGPPTLAIFAGRNARILGATGLATTLDFGVGGSLARDPITGDLYLTYGCQILIMHADTGVLERWAGDPTNCTHAGDGAPLSQVRFGLVSNTSRSGILVDGARNVYWLSKAGVWRYDRATDMASIYLGKVNAPFSSSDGTDRRSFSLVGLPTMLDFGAGDRLYFAITQQCHTTPVVGSFADCTVIYRVENNGSITAIAGSMDPNASLPTEGLSGKLGWILSFSVMPGGTMAQDRFFTVGGGSAQTTNGLWEILANGSFHLLRAGIGSAVGHYQPVRKALTVVRSNSGIPSVTFVNPDNPALAIPGFNGYDGVNTGFHDIAGDDVGGLYLAGDSGRIVSYYDPSNVRTDYIGLAPSSGDGGPANYAQFRSPTLITFDPAGNTYVEDSGNGRVRRIDPTGVISQSTVTFSGSGDQYLFSSGTSPKGPYFTNRYSYGSVMDVTGSCVYFCGAAALPMASQITASSTPATLPPRGGPVALYGTNIAFDGPNIYLFMTERTTIVAPAGNDVVTSRTFIKKIDGSGNMTEIAGNQAAVPTPTMPGVAAGQPLLGSSAGDGNANFSMTNFQAVNGAIYQQQGALYTGTEGGTWVQQTAGGISSYTVDPTNNLIYFTAGTRLYRKAYAAAGGGTETMFADFTGALVSPKIRAKDQNQPNTLLLTDGDSVYRFNDAVNIP